MQNWEGKLETSVQKIKTLEGTGPENLDPERNLKTWKQ